MAFKKLVFERHTPERLQERAKEFHQLMRQRRSVRQFSARPVPLEVIKTIVRTAATAPSGANKQPWRFVIVRDPEVKRTIRQAAEKEEREFYQHRATREWLEDLDQFKTDWHKEFLEIAPYLIVVFKKVYDVESGMHRKNYYVMESVGIACGFLLAAIHNAGLVALTHTPSPMRFLQEILKRPENEKPYLLIPVGYPAEEARVPVLKKKPFREIATVV